MSHNVNSSKRGKEQAQISPSAIVDIVNENGCFDLQFRRDVKTNRPGKPVYFSWKVQFVINLKEDGTALLNQVKQALGCGAVHISGGFARYSIQDIENLHHVLVPFFQKYSLEKNKARDFQLWAQAVSILFANKHTKVRPKSAGTQWTKEKFQSMLDIHKDMQPYKTRGKTSTKWLKEAEAFAQMLENPSPSPARNA